MSEVLSDLDVTRERLVEAIGRSDRGKWTIKIKTLMAEFGYTAVQRVRQSALLAVLDQLTTWDMAYHLPYGSTANDYITLSRDSRPEAPPRALETSAPAAQGDQAFPTGHPLAFVFHVGDTLDDDRSQTTALDLEQAVWACRPVCLFVQASDEFFAFACGFFAAMMRRWALMIRGSSGDMFLPLAPDLLTIERLKRLLGHTGDGELRESFPATGAVYLLRDHADEVEDDELLALVREGFVPHTYRLYAKYATTCGPHEQGLRACEALDFPQILRWFAAVAGTLQLPLPAADDLIDLASLFAETMQRHDHLLERQALVPVDPAFRAGFESSEHMALKSALLRGLRQSHPGAAIAVEELMPPRVHETWSDDEPLDRSRRDKPDLRMGDQLWIEVETLRSIARPGSNPFFELESKLRHKVSGMRGAQRVWLIVPSDVALLATASLRALVRNLNGAIGTPTLQCGFVDLLNDTPVFLSPGDPPPLQARLVGRSWRATRIKPAERTLTWADVAGYADVKARLREQVLAPLLDPDRYARHGIAPANGLLLYGLPGCGKSLIGRVLAGEAGLLCRLVQPSDLSSQWLQGSVMKTRELFDWALKRAPCLIILDELDAVAPQRREQNMHTDEMRQVNELLAQFDRVNGKGIVVVATTNYARGLDAAVQRSGRFDLKMPVFPPDCADRIAIFQYYLSATRLPGVTGLNRLNLERLAEETTLFTPADIKTVVETTARHAIDVAAGGVPSLSTEDLLETVRHHPRSIRREMAIAWTTEVVDALDPGDTRLLWFREEIARAFGTSA